MSCRFCGDVSAEIACCDKAMGYVAGRADERAAILARGEEAVRQVTPEAGIVLGAFLRLIRDGERVLK